MRTLKDQLHRLQSVGFPTTRGLTMLSAYSSILSPSQREHASSLEMLDEVEEWEMIMSHYFLAVGSNEKGLEGGKNDTNTANLLDPNR